MTSSSLTLQRDPAHNVCCLPDSRIIDRVGMMCSSALFAGLRQEECRDIASFSKPRIFARDEILFMQGHTASNVLLLQVGVVKLTQLSPMGEEVLLWMTGANDVLGVQVTSNCTNSCSARAMERCVALSWEYAWMRSLLARYPQIRININQILSSRLQELEERFREVATERVAKRLGLTLLRLMKQVGRPHGAGTQLLLSRAELAQMVGTTLFTTSRILSKWSLCGVVIARREAVIVIDPRRLALISEED
jgi:CRP/FNR family transcriptional regulator, nitrogen oxide reductase regulator